MAEIWGHIYQPVNEKRGRDSSSTFKAKSKILKLKDLTENKITCSKI